MKKKLSLDLDVASLGRHVLLFKMKQKLIENYNPPPHRQTILFQIILSCKFKIYLTFYLQILNSFSDII